MAFVRKCILPFALVFCLSAFSQDVKFIYQSKIGTGNIDTVSVWAISMTNSPVSLGAVNLSWVFKSSCLSYTPGNFPAPNSYWSIFRDTWGSLLDFDQLQNISVTYDGNLYDRRVQYGNAIAFFPVPVVVPASSQPPRLVMKLWFTGSCTSQVYMEDESENGLNQIADPNNSLLTYIIENVLNQPLANPQPKAEVEELVSSQLSLSPNPSDGQVKLSFPDGYTQGRIELYDLNGRLLYEEISAFDLPKNLSFSHLPVGRYLLRVISEGGESWSKKMIIR